MKPTIAALLALACAAPAAAEAPRRTTVCLADHGWGIDRYQVDVLPDGQLRFAGDGGGLVPADRLSGAAGRDWFEGGEPISFEGRTYKKSGAPRPDDWPLGRYNRFKPPYRGVPMMEPLGGEDRRLLVLVNPIGCIFQPYEVEAAPR